MRSDLFTGHLESSSSDPFVVQNKNILKVNVQGSVHAMQGSMIAYQGQLDFEYKKSGVKRFLKQAATGESVSLMTVTGQGELFLAQDAGEIHLVHLEGDSITVNGANLLAFSDGIDWDVRRVKGGAMAAGGLFNVELTGTGYVAVLCHGSPVVIGCADAPAYVDTQAAVAWTSSLQTSLKSTFKAGALIGRGSGEAMQLVLSGQGFVIVQGSEGPPVAQVDGGGGGLLNLLT
jgi:uncharacterized protein (AIM24 family)